MGWGAVHFYTPLNRTGEQILTDEEKSKRLCWFCLSDGADIATQSSSVSQALNTEIITPSNEIPQPTKEISLLIPPSETEMPNKIIDITTKIR